MSENRRIEAEMARGKDRIGVAWPEGSGRPDSEKKRLVEVMGLEKRFKRLEVLKGIDLEVRGGEIVSILGQSGGGKSTLLRCINLLEIPNGGTLRVEGQEVFSNGELRIRRSQFVALRRRVGMVFQQFNLFPHLTACENITLPLVRGVGMSDEEAVGRAHDGLSHVGLLSKALAYPDTLSGGEKQRVAIARALALRPAVLLFDEPTSSLDPESTTEVLSVLRRLAEEGMTMIVATHEIGFAATVADKAAFIDEGRIVEIGPAAEMLRNPAERRTREFLGRAEVG